MDKNVDTGNQRKRKYGGWPRCISLIHCNVCPGQIHDSALTSHVHVHQEVAREGQDNRPVFWECRFSLVLCTTQCTLSLRTAVNRATLVLPKGLDLLLLLLLLLLVLHTVSDT